MSRVLHTVTEISRQLGCDDRQIRGAIIRLGMQEHKRQGGVRLFTATHKKQIKAWLKKHAKTGPLAQKTS